MEQINIEYKFKSENRWNNLQIPFQENAWENVRFLIENKHKMHETAKGNKKTYQGYSYVDGFYCDLDGSCKEQIKDYDFISPETKILVVRKPLLNGKKLCIPVQQQKIFNENMSEEEKIKAIVDNAANYNFIQKNSYLQQSSSPSKKPANHYICYYCGLLGEHFFKNCPKKLDDKFKPLYKRKMPSGMPLSLFKNATTEEEKNRAFITATGQWLVPK